MGLNKQVPNGYVTQTVYIVAFNTLLHSIYCCIQYTVAFNILLHSIY